MVTLTTEYFRFVELYKMPVACDCSKMEISNCKLLDNPKNPTNEL